MTSRAWMGRLPEAAPLMLRLKADLHTHCADDPRDRIDYSAEMLIDAVAQLNFDVLAIALHKRVGYTERLAAYARERGILLIPAIELRVENKHVLVLNPDAEQVHAQTFAELRRLGRRGAAFIAPHPFYPGRSCLHGRLVENIDLFDGIEYCSLYLRGLNPNRKAVRVARRFGLPLIGTSDTHAMPFSDSTFSMIEAREASTEAVVDALRQGRVSLVTRPRPVLHAALMVTFFVRDQLESLAGPFRQEAGPP